VQSSPPGVEVFADGEQRGQTPARVSPAGRAHPRAAARVPRVTPINVTAGGQVSQFIEFADAGDRRVAGAVAADGCARPGGRRRSRVAPVTVSSPSPGDHEVVLQSPAALQQVVSV
jgi:hypothetical protein